jgi:DNA-binding LacI/PurR family transcriptional regulator
MSLLTSRTLEHLIGPVMPSPGSGVGTGMIGVLSLDPSPYRKAMLLSGIQQATGLNGYCVSIVTPRGQSRRSLRDSVQWLRRLSVDGILVLAPERDAIETLAELSVDVPLVVLGAPPQEILPAITSDHYAGAAAATRHLLELGHRTVFHIGTVLDRIDPGSRLAGWHDTLVAAGAEIPTAMISDGSPEGGYESGRRLASRREVTAIFTASDQMALGVLSALFEARRRVPKDVSVVGFGGMPEGEFFSPPLTTIRQNFTEIGRRGAGLLQAEIEAGRLGRVHETIPAELILRASTASAA